MSFLTFLTAVAYVPGIPSYSTAGRWAVIIVGSSGLFLLWNARVLLGPAHLLGAFFVAYGLESVLWSVTPAETLGQAIQFVFLAIVFCLAADERDLSKAMKALALGLVPSLIAGVLQWNNFHPVKAVTGNVPGLFLSSNTMASLAAVSLAGCVAYRQWWYAIPGASLVAMNVSREAYVGLAATALFALMARLKWWQNALGVVALTALAVAFLYLDLNSTAGRIGSINDRLVFWQLGLANITPLGYGLGSSVAIWPQFEHFHNEFIEYAFELGFGAFALLGVVVYALRSTSPARWPFVCLLVTCAFNFNLHEPMGAFLFALLAGFLAGTCDRELGFQPVRRVLVGIGAFGGEPLGVGALCEADIRSGILPARPKYPARARALS